MQITFSRKWAHTLPFLAEAGHFGVFTGVRNSGRDGIGARWLRLGVPVGLRTGFR